MRKKGRSQRYLEKEAGGRQVYIGGRDTGTLSGEGRDPRLGGRQTRKVRHHVLDYTDDVLGNRVDVVDGDMALRDRVPDVLDVGKVHGQGRPISGSGSTFVSALAVGITT